jgi:hypothetical protein
MVTSMQFKNYDSYSNEAKPLSSLLKNLMEKFKVEYAETLFTPNWEALEVDYCPICGFKLYKMRSKPLWFCKSTSHKGFIIRDKVKKEVVYELRETRKRKEEWEEKKKMYQSQVRSEYRPKI